MNKSDNALRTIGETAELLEVPQHVIRFWENSFSNLKPIKYNNRRYYSPNNIAILKQIKNLLYIQKYSIKDAAKFFAKPKINVNILEKIHKRLIKAREKLNIMLQK